MSEYTMEVCTYPRVPWNDAPGIRPACTQCTQRKLRARPMASPEDAFGPCQVLWDGVARAGWSATAAVASTALAAFQRCLRLRVGDGRRALASLSLDRDALTLVGRPELSNRTKEPVPFGGDDDAAFAERRGWGGVALGLTILCLPPSSYTPTPSPPALQHPGRAPPQRPGGPLPPATLARRGAGAADWQTGSGAGSPGRADVRGQGHHGTLPGVRAGPASFLKLRGGLPRPLPATRR
jgi:hypothetical protein